MAFSLSGTLNLRLASNAATTLRNDISRALNLGNAVPQINAATAALGGLNRAANQTGTSFTAMTARAAAAGLGFTSLTGVAVGLGAALRASVKEAIAFDRELVRLAQVAEEPAAVVRALGDDVTRLATGLGVSSLELLRTATVIKQAGYSLRDTRTVIDAIGRATLAPNFRNANQIAELVIALRQFKVEANDVKGALGSANAVAGAFAVEASDLAEAVQRAGGAAANAKVSYSQFFGLLTSIRATTREDAASISTGLRTIFARLQRSDTIDELHRLGIELRHTRAEAEKLGDFSLEGQFVGGYEAVRRLSEAMSRVPTTDPRYSSVIESLGGYRQISRVIPLLQQFATAQRAVAVAEAGRASIDVSAAQAQDAYGVKLQKAREQMAALVRSATESRGFSLLVGGLEKGADAAARLVRELGPLVPLLGALAAYRLGAAGLGALGVTGAGLVGGLTRGRVLAGGGLLAAGLAPSVLGGDSPTGGALQGAAAGALVGSAFGPWGAAIGGATGAVLGFRDSLNSARETVRQSAIDASLLAVGHRLVDLRAGTNPLAAESLNELLTSARRGVEEKAAASSSGFLFGQVGAAEYAQTFRAETLKTFGPRATEFAEVLSRQAELTGRGRPGADPDKLIEEFAAANRQLFAVVAGINQQTPDAALKPFADIIRTAQSSASRQGEGQRVAADLDRSAAAFGRLVDSVDRAASSLTGLTARGSALAALTEGGAVGRPAALDVDNLEVLARLARPLGAGGDSLLSSVRAGENLKTVLPAVLSELAAGNPLDGASFGTAVRSAVVKALGGSVTGDETRYAGVGGVTGWRSSARWTSCPTTG